MNSTFLLILLLVTHTVSGYEEEISDWNWDAGIPHFPHAKYDDNDEVVFFPRIIGGTPAFHGEFLSIVSLQSRAGHHMCGGSLIDFRHILSAAHCLTSEFGHVFELSSIRLMANDLLIENRGASPARQIRFPTHLFVHPEYNLDTFANDIAVIRVSVAFYHVPQLFPLPRSIATPADNEVCFLAGWGVTHPLRSSPHPILLRVDLDIISMNFCNGTQSYNGRMPSNFFCAGTLDGSRDACFGDSGGGLICRNQIAGVVSFGFGCGRRNFPGAYVDVSRYNPWISECINSNLEHENIPRPSTIDPNSSSSRNFITHKFFFIFFTVTVASMIYR